MRERFARRGITTSKELTTRLLDEAHVAVLPGIDFLRPIEELSFRVAFVDFKNLDQGIARLAAWLLR